MADPICARCRQTKPDSQFKRRGLVRGGRFSYCKECCKEYDSERLKVAKIEAFRIYGDSRCCCCGITEQVFLCLDHINNNGNVERKLLGESTGSGVQFYSRLKRLGWPPGYQVLCYNCNMAKHLLGECPHQLGNRLNGRPSDSGSDYPGSNPGSPTNFLLGGSGKWQPHESLELVDAGSNPARPATGESSSGQDCGLQNRPRGFESLLPCHFGRVWRMVSQQVANLPSCKGHGGSSPLPSAILEVL